MLQKSETQIWMETEKALEDDYGVGFTISQGTRTNLVHVMDAYRRGGMSWEGFIQTVRSWPHEPQRQSPKIKGIPEPVCHGKSMQRASVLAALLAADANQDPEVTQFREEVLRGVLLEAHEIQPWIAREREKEQGRPGIFLDAVPLPPRHDIRHGAQGGLIPDPPLSIGEQHPAGSSHVDLLAYATPESDWERVVPVGHGGILARLHHLSTRLAERYRWQAAQATSFVLTGLTPALPPIAASLKPVDFQTQAGRVTALSRIVLTIDPTLSPKEVHNYFQAIRQRILGVKWRALKETQLALAQAVLHCRDEDSWSQRMDLWNTEFPNRPYNNVSNFRRDCQHAIAKLLAPVPLAMPLHKGGFRSTSQKGLA
jgi:hypothetical protein